MTSKRTEAAAQKENPRRRSRVEFGDFQTPPALANRICRQLRQCGVSPSTIIEPTCGLGSLLFAAADTFPAATYVTGIDVNDSYIKSVRGTIDARPDASRFCCERRDILLDGVVSPMRAQDLPDPWLIIGNPPWVTNAAVGTIRGANLPHKSNLDGRRGIDARTGHSNFDISEWILRELAGELNGRCGTLAMLCKTSVARKLLTFVWRQGMGVRRASIHTINTTLEFGVTVDACLLVCEFSPGAQTMKADLYEDIESSEPVAQIGWRANTLVADLQRWDQTQSLHAEPTRTPTCEGKKRRWRSGIKHDCAAVLELQEFGRLWRNRFGEIVDVEPDCVFPLLKSSDLANQETEHSRYWLLVPQQSMADDPARLQETAPKSWQYLMSHADRLDQRRSSIYRNRHRFAVFGVGDYSFAPWKVAISGFYKKLHFTVVGSIAGRPTVLDDTCYSLACETQAEAEAIAHALNSSVARDFFATYIFWDAKRPINAELLNRLDIDRLLARLFGTTPAFKKEEWEH